MDRNIDDLSEYIRTIVEPTFADYQKNPNSERLAYLTCIAIFHCVDRATFPLKSASLREKWGKKSIEFLVVDMVAHHLKHVRCGQEIRNLYNKKDPEIPAPLPLSFLLENLDFHNLYYAMRDAILFIKTQIPQVTEDNA